jgi:hypothetical protein
MLICFAAMRYCQKIATLSRDGLKGIKDLAQLIDFSARNNLVHVTY